MKKKIFICMISLFGCNLHLYAVYCLNGEVWVYEHPSHIVSILLATIQKNSPIYGFTCVCRGQVTDENLIGYAQSAHDDMCIYKRWVPSLEKPAKSPCYWVYARALFDTYRSAATLQSFSNFYIQTWEDVPKKDLLLSTSFLRTIGRIQQPAPGESDEQTDQFNSLEKLARSGYDKELRRTHTDSGTIIPYGGK